MQTFRVSLTPNSAFGTPPKGDTLFGQLCWAVRNRFGEPRLRALLAGYMQDQPFAVVSDALPTGHLPRPVLPTSKPWTASLAEDRKAVKKRAWLPLSAFHYPVSQWVAHCVPPSALLVGATLERPQPHNSINRATITTGNGFDPYSMPQRWYGRARRDNGEPNPPPSLDLVVVLDETRFSGDELRILLADIGLVGFGRDASIGLGKFEVKSCDPWELPAHPGADAWLTLAPCAPQGLAWDQSRCFYQPFTRFGRHGDIGVHLGNPFKTPVLLADTGAVLAPSSGIGADVEKEHFIGRGLGGDGSLSTVLPSTVHQGYAPIVAIKLPHVWEGTI